MSQFWWIRTLIFILWYRVTIFPFTNSPIHTPKHIILNVWKTLRTNNHLPHHHPESISYLFLGKRIGPRLHYDSNLIRKTCSWCSQYQYCFITTEILNGGCCCVYILYTQVSITRKICEILTKSGRICSLSTVCSESTPPQPLKYRLWIWNMLDSLSFLVICIPMGPRKYRNLSGVKILSWDLLLIPGLLFLFATYF